MATGHEGILSLILARRAPIDTSRGIEDTRDDFIGFSRCRTQAPTERDSYLLIRSFTYAGKNALAYHCTAIGTDSGYIRQLIGASGAIWFTICHNESSYTEKCKIEYVTSHTPTTSCVLSAGTNIQRIHFKDHRMYFL